MTTVDPRWSRSRATLLSAVTTLLDAGATPSVTEIVAEAGVSRPTFYQHFGDLPTAYAEAGLARVQEQFDKISLPESASEVDRARIESTIAALASHLYDHLTFYRTVLREASSRRLSENIVQFLADRMSAVPLGAAAQTGDQAAQDQVTALSAGLFWLITHWLEDDDCQPIDEMAQRIASVLLALAPRGASF